MNDNVLPRRGYDCAKHGCFNQKPYLKSAVFALCQPRQNPLLQNGLFHLQPVPVVATALFYKGFNLQRLATGCLFPAGCLSLVALPSAWSLGGCSAPAISSAVR